MPDSWQLLSRRLLFTKRSITQKNEIILCRFLSKTKIHFMIKTTKLFVELDNDHVERSEVHPSFGDFLDSTSNGKGFSQLIQLARWSKNVGKYLWQKLIDLLGAIENVLCSLYGGAIVGKLPWVQIVPAHGSKVSGKFSIRWNSLNFCLFKFVNDSFVVYLFSSVNLSPLRWNHFIRTNTLHTLKSRKKTTDQITSLLWATNVGRRRPRSWSSCCWCCCCWWCCW